MAINTPEQTSPKTAQKGILAKEENAKNGHAQTGVLLVRSLFSYGTAS